MDNRWRKYQGALLWTGNPKSEFPTESEAKAALRETNAMFARWTTNWDSSRPTQWWYCIKDTYSSLSDLSSKQRYRVNKGLKHCRVVRILRQDILHHIDSIYQVAKEAFADYPIQYRPVVRYADYEHWLSHLPDNQDIWLCIEIATDNVIGYAVCEQTTGYINLRQVKVPTAKLSTEANAAIVYSIQEYYLNYCKGQYAFICDGERNIKHQTAYQDYLIRVLNFRLSYCTLNIVYSPKMQLIVNILYPLRAGVKKLGKINSFFYNVYCVLFMEQIRRLSK